MNSTQRDLVATRALELVPLITEYKSVNDILERMARRACVSHGIEQAHARGEVSVIIETREGVYTMSVKPEIDSRRVFAEIHDRFEGQL